MLYPVGVVKRALGLFTDVQLRYRRAVLEQYRVIQRGLAIYGIVTAAHSAGTRRVVIPGETLR